SESIDSFASALEPKFSLPRLCLQVTKGTFLRNWAYHVTPSFENFSIAEVRSQLDNVNFHTEFVATSELGAPSSMFIFEYWRDESKII
ncbi:uncharacterized protein N7529_002740, partial [Penicillium soppii]|uniref:uncharacterized protein n=1 Tax=Penicillium soppii TaxID=69789 RepID=UPI002548BD53